MNEQIIKLLKLCFNKSPEDAIKYLESQGIDISWDWKAQLDIISQHCFTVTKVTNADILQTVKDELKQAMDNGTTFSDFKKNLEPLLEQKGYVTKEDGSAWRLDTIYRTNLQSSYMAGRFNEMLDVADDFPYWQYISVLDSRTRPAHAGLNGKVVRSDDSFWSTHYPPNGYMCRCRVRALSDEELKNKGLKVTKGKNLKAFKPDEGFNNNPADQWFPDLTKYDTDIKKYLKKDLKNV